MNRHQASQRIIALARAASRTGVLGDRWHVATPYGAIRRRHLTIDVHTSPLSVASYVPIDVASSFGKAMADAAPCSTMVHGSTARFVDARKFVAVDGRCCYIDGTGLFSAFVTLLGQPTHIGRRIVEADQLYLPRVGSTAVGWAGRGGRWEAVCMGIVLQRHTDWRFGEVAA